MAALWGVRTRARWERRTRAPWAARTRALSAPPTRGRWAVLELARPAPRVPAAARMLSVRPPARSIASRRVFFLRWLQQGALRLRAAISTGRQGRCHEYRSYRAVPRRDA